jgi:hypothetical protein
MRGKTRHEDGHDTDVRAIAMSAPALCDAADLAGPTLRVRIEQAVEALA